MYKKLQTILLLFCPLLVLSQNTIGIPNIINYPKQVYGAGSQNWSMVQDQNGIMYFANNQGLLTFDGTFWRKYQLPNKTIVRSLAVGKENRIYVGGQSEFGYFTADKNGELVYTSLMDLLPRQEREFTDIWNICIFQGKVFFRSYKKILAYDHKKLIVYNDTHWNFLGGAGTGLWAFEYEKGLVAYKDGKWLPAYRSGQLPAGINFKTALDLGNDSILLVSLLHGLYLLRHDTISSFQSPFINSIAKQNIYGAALLDPDRIALITNLSGCMIIDRKGRFIQRFTKKEGIQNNNVLSLLLDRDKNLWLGLDNGIDLITYSNAIKNIFPEEEDRNAGYAAFIHKNQLYLGVATGAFKIDLGNVRDLSYTTGKFEPVQNSRGQVWGFSEVNGQLLMGHNSGAYQIENNKAIAFDVKTGFWDFQPLSNDKPSPIMIAGTYNGINFYHYQNGVISNPKIHAQFESARFVVIHNGVIWIAHPYKGIYKVTFNAQNQPIATAYQDKKGILSSNHNKIFKIGGKMILSTDNGLFEYSHQSQDFVPAAYFTKLFGKATPGYLKEDKYGNIWFSRDRKIGVVDRSGGKQELIFIPQLNDRIVADGFENILVIDSSNVLIAAEKGFFHINYAQYKKSRYPLNVLIRKVRSPLQSGEAIYGGYSKPNATPSIDYKYNALHFEFSSTLYGQESNTEYSYFLEGFDKGWSEWQRKTEKDYTNLPAGDYIFKVKCRNNFNNESSVSSYAFSILPPWYQTWWAYILYGITFSGLLFLIYKRQQRRYKKIQRQKLQEQQRKWEEEQKQLQILHQLEIGENEKQIIRLKNEKLQAELEQKKLQEEQERLHFLHQIEVQKAEKEIIALRNEKLQVEVEHKNSELASSAMNLVRKMEVFSKLKEDLLQFKVSSGIERTAKEKEFLKIIKLLDTELDAAQEWEQFSRHFDSVHTNYLKKLKEFCPDLTSTELKLAAYLRLNLTTKEIAQLMNISVRGVETSRYRLRKKLNLTKEESNLYDFLLTITNEKSPV